MNKVKVVRMSTIDTEVYQRQEISRLCRKIAIMRKALNSIASNTCCQACQEAKLVALAALEKIKA